MISFKTDMEHAKAVLTILKAMLSESILECEGISKHSFSSSVLDFFIEFKNGAREVIGGFENVETLSEIQNVFTYSYFAYVPHTETILFPNSGKSIILELDNKDEPTEEWYFQQSLIYSEMELTALTIYKLVRTIPCNFHYFSLNSAYINTVLERLNYDN